MKGEIHLASDLRIEIEIAYVVIKVAETGGGFDRKPKIAFAI